MEEEKTNAVINTARTSNTKLVVVGGMSVDCSYRLKSHSKGEEGRYCL